MVHWTNNFFKIKETIQLETGGGDIQTELILCIHKLM